jgi:AcrR family transcriptional regulator
MTGGKKPVRRRTERAQRREQILAAAFEEFAVNGYAGACLDDVARRAQIAKGTIFLHFRSKRVLFRAVLRGFIRPVFSGFHGLLHEFSGTSDVLLRDLLSRQYVDVVGNCKARALLRLVIAEGGKFPELAQTYYREIVAPGTSALGLVIDRGIASGEFQPGIIRNFPQILAAPVVLAIVWTLVLGERHGLDFDAYREAHLDFVLRGLRGATPIDTPESVRTKEFP